MQFLFPTIESDIDIPLKIFSKRQSRAAHWRTNFAYNSCVVRYARRSRLTCDPRRVAARRRRDFIATSEPALICCDEAPVAVCLSILLITKQTNSWPIRSEINILISKTGPHLISI